MTLSAAQSHAQAFAWIPFDDGTANDATSNGNDGVILGTPTFKSGIVGDAIVLDRGDSVSIPTSPELETSTPSIMGWVRFERVGSNRRSRVISKNQIGVGGYTLSVLNSGQLSFDVSAGADRVTVITPYSLVLNVWTHFFATYDGTDARLYVHGELAAEASFPGIDPTNSAPVEIGGRMRGLVDELRLGANAGSATFACNGARKIWHNDSGTCIPAMLNVAEDEGLQDTGNRSFGATLVDIDQDGWLDLYYINGAGDPVPPHTINGICPPLPDPIPFIDGSFNVLHMNNGDGTFGPNTAVETGLDDGWNAMRHVWADFDRDGLRDVMSHNFVLSTLYRQTSAQPLTFQNWNDESGLNVCLRRGTGASFVDFNFDGFLDMHLVEYDPTRLAVDHLQEVYISDGLGGFTETADQMGLNLPDNPMGQAWADYDNDGDQDLFQTNSHEVPTRLYRNNGINGGTGLPTFTDVGSIAGVAVIGEPDRGIGASWGDYNNDRRLDLLFSREGDSHLWRNDGPNENGDWTFTDMSNTGGFETVLGLGFWGGGFADLDNDGFLDIVLSNRTNGENRVLFNNGDETFREVTSELGMLLEDLPSMGFVAGDRDNDGDVDLVIVSHSPVSSAPEGFAFEGDPNFVYVNDSRGNNWVQFRLTGTVSNLEAVGARIEVRSRLQPGAPATWQNREVNAGTGFFSDYPRVQTFGLGKAQTVEGVRIRWPNGLIQNIGALAINTLYEFIEPAP